MTKLGKLSMIPLAALALAVGAERASAGPGGFGGHGGMRMGHGEAVFPLLLRAVHPTPEQQAKIADIMKSHRTKLGPLFQQMKQAHDELAAKLLGPGPVTATDVAPAIQHLGQIRQQLMQDWVDAALEARAVLTTDQLAKAADVKQRLDALHGQIEQLLGPMPMMSPDGLGD